MMTAAADQNDAPGSVAADQREIAHGNFSRAKFWGRLAQQILSDRVIDTAIKRGEQMRARPDGITVDVTYELRAAECFLAGALSDLHRAMRRIDIEPRYLDAEDILFRDIGN